MRFLRYRFFGTLFQLHVYLLLNKQCTGGVVSVGIRMGDICNVKCLCPLHVLIKTSKPVAKRAL